LLRDVPGATDAFLARIFGLGASGFGLSDASTGPAKKYLRAPPLESQNSKRRSYVSEQKKSDDPQVPPIALLLLLARLLFYYQSILRHEGVYETRGYSYDYLFTPTVSISKMIGGCGPIDTLPAQNKTGV